MQKIINSNINMGRFNLPKKYYIHKEISMIIDVGYWTRILKNIAVLIISLILIFLSFKLAVFYMPFLIGFIISLIVEPLIKFVVKKTKLERKKCDTSLSNNIWNIIRITCMGNI